MDKFVPTFETRRPVWGAEFHDRRELLDRLSRQLRDHLSGRPSWVVLLGPRKVGKTSILQELYRSMEGQLGPVVFLDLFRTDSRVQDVFLAYIVELLAAACRSKGGQDLAERVRAAPMALEGDLAHAVSTTLPFEATGRALALAGALRARSIDGTTVAEILELPERFAVEIGPVWVVLDELQELEALNRQQPFNKRHTVYRLMRSVWQGHEKVSYWGTGSQVSMLTRLFTDRRSPFHGHFQLVEVPPFAVEQATELLLERLPDRLEGPQAGDAARMAVEALGAHPFYVQLLGEELELRQIELTRQGINSVLQEILLSPSGRLALHLQGVIEADAGKGHQLAVLRALASGEASLSELVSRRPSFGRDATHAVLRRLEAADLVTRDHRTHRFRVADRALAAYLRMGGLSPDPPPAVIGAQGERIAARHLMGQGLRPVYQSYRSLGPADLVVLEPGRRLAIQVKATPSLVTLSESEFQRMIRWAHEQQLLPVLCQVELGAPERVRYWPWSAARKTGQRRKFDPADQVATALELLPPPGTLGVKAFE